MKCILPETFPGITFNPEGICNFCLNHKDVQVHGEAKLREILNTEKGEVYDCVVPISGGKDSIYALYYAVKMLGLRAVAVNYDSGFQSELAKENMKNACRILGTPLLIVKADYENHAKMLREILLVSEVLGAFFAVCGNCEANIRAVATNIAKKYRIPFILYGRTISEDTEQFSFTGASGFLRNIATTNMRYIPKVLFHIIKYCLYSIRQRIQIGVHIRYRFFPGQIFPPPLPKKRVRTIFLYDYIECDLSNKINLLKEKLGWKFPSYPHRFDCLLHCFVNHRYLQTTGISADGFNYSRFIREKKMKREDALLFEKRIEERLEEECLQTLEKIGLKHYGMPKTRVSLLRKK